MRKIVTISLPEKTARQVDRMVARGGYTSTSELFRDMLREWTGAPAYGVPVQHSHAPWFRTHHFIRAVKKHARKGAVKSLSRNHDRYLYGA